MSCVTLARRRACLGVGGAVFVTVAAVYFKLDGQLPDRPGLDRLGKAGVLSQFQRRQTEELRSRPEALGPIHGQKLKSGSVTGCKSFSFIS